VNENIKENSLTQEDLIPENSSKSLTNLETSYLKTMSNDDDNDNDCPPIKPIFLPKITIFSPKKIITFAESFNKEIPNSSSKEVEKEMPFSAYNCQSIVEITLENMSLNSIMNYEKILSDSQFNVIQSQIIEKIVSERSFSMVNEKIEKSSNASPKLDEFYSRPHELNERKASYKTNKLKESEIQTFFTFNETPSIQILINKLNLNQFSAEEIVEAVFSNEPETKISHTVFKIKLEVKFIS